MIEVILSIVIFGLLITGMAVGVLLGRKPISYKYYPDMSKHYAHGTDETLKKLNTEAAKTL